MLAGSATLLKVGTRAGRALDIDEVPLRRACLRWHSPSPAHPLDLSDAGQLATALLSCVPLLSPFENLVAHSATVYTLGVPVKRIDAYLCCMHNGRMAPRIKRRKATRKEEMVPIRMTTEQKATLATAAERRGLPLSTWLLTLGLKEASGDKA